MIKLCQSVYICVCHFMPPLVGGVSCVVLRDTLSRIPISTGVEYLLCELSFDCNWYVVKFCSQNKHYLHEHYGL